MTDRCRQGDALEVPRRDATETLEADRELESPPVLRELMDLVDDDVPHAPEVTLHHLSGENRLQSLGGGYQNVWRVCRMLPALRGWSGPVPHGCRVLGGCD